MSFYSGLAAVATRLLTDKGQLLTFTRETSTAFDHTVGENTVTTSTFTGYGAAFDYNRNEIDGVIIAKGDIRLILNATDTAPSVSDTTVIDGDTYRVMSIKKTAPAGTVVAYELQLRK
jgi:hypothetical protein